jgi:hypothetical protein
MVVHPLEAVQHGREQNLGHLGVEAVLRHALDQGALFNDPLLGVLDVPQRLRQMVSLNTHHYNLSVITGMPGGGTVCPVDDLSCIIFSFARFSCAAERFTIYLA